MGTSVGIDSIMVTMPTLSLSSCGCRAPALEWVGRCIDVTFCVPPQLLAVAREWRHLGLRGPCPVHYRGMFSVLRVWSWVGLG